MSDETKWTNNDSNRAAQDSQCHVCPFMLASGSAWQSLLRPPFRKRHPFLYWGFLCLIAVSAFAITGRYLSAGDDSTERIALIRIAGPIMDPGDSLAWIRRVENNANVRGALVRVDSPGGGAAASQEIYAALARLAKRVPVVVSMGATAASGGLMVSMAGERIYANPSTVTGSIGVRMDIPQLQGLMGKLGIGQETLVTAPFKDAASYTHPLTAEDRAYLQGVLMNMHDQFVDIIAEGRKMPREKVVKLANGKIYTGQEAKELGLIDALGGQDDAQIWLARKCGVPADRKLLEKPVSKTRLLEKLLATGRLFGLDFGELENFDSTRFTQPAFLY